MTKNIFGNNTAPMPFNSFWMAGYECSDKLNVHGNRVDFLKITGHLKCIDEDYEALGLFNIKTVREGIRWSQVEKKPYVYDWSVVGVMIEAATRHSIQQVWDLCHFGFPDDLTPLHPQFATRFKHLCDAFIKFYRSKNPAGPVFIIPINEISFLSWLGGDVACTAPYCKHNGWEVKYNLIKAAIQGIKILQQDPDVVILTSEPLINIVPPEHATEEEKIHSLQKHQYQYQVTDGLTGRICPELGGSPDLIDIIGVNYYYNNQWISGPETRLFWKQVPADTRWRPLRFLLKEVYDRYGKPIAITETGHPTEDRPLWIQQVAGECKAAIGNDVEMHGVCLYPAIDRPDWDDVITWHRSGIWDIENSTTLERILYRPFAKAILEAQKIIAISISVQELSMDLP